MLRQISLTLHIPETLFCTPTMSWLPTLGLHQDQDLHRALPPPCWVYSSCNPCRSPPFNFYLQYSTLKLIIYLPANTNQYVLFFFLVFFFCSSRAPVNLVHNLRPVSQHVSSHVICFVTSPVIFNRRRLTQLSAVSTHHSRMTGWHIFHLSLCGIFITLLCLALRWFCFFFFYLCPSDCSHQSRVSTEFSLSHLKPFYVFWDHRCIKHQN